MRLLLGDGLEHVPVVLRLSPPEEVPTPSQRPHLLEVDPRRDELVAPRRRLREHLALRVDDAALATPTTKQRFAYAPARMQSSLRSSASAEIGVL